MDDENDDERYPNLAEALISLWQVNKKGQMKKIKQVSFDYEKFYSATKALNMRLMLSHDQCFVSLGLISEDHKKVNVMVWDTRNLKPREIDTRVQNKLTL